MAQTRHLELLLTLAYFVLLAAAVRLPSFVLPSLTWDEGIYLVIAAELNDGHLPYITVWDRKPIGIFLIYALIERLFSDALFGLRLAACLAVALAAFLLHNLARLLFADRIVGLAAGSAFVLASLQNGGVSTNTEVFYIPLTLLGLYLAVRGSLRGEALSRRTRFMLDAGSGLALGIALQIKYVVAFDLVAFLLAYFILTTPRPGDLGGHARRSLPKLATIALAAGLPTVVVALVYAAAGQFEAFAFANFGANGAYASLGFASPARIVGLVVNHGPLWVGAALALALGRRITRDGGERRVLLAAAVWIAAVLAGITVLKMWNPQYFMQLLPPLSLLTGFLIGRGVLTGLGSAPARAAAALLLGSYAFLAMCASFFMLAGDVALERLRGDARWGDVSAHVVEDIKPALAPGDGLYVFDYDPILYFLADAEVPTRYAFPEFMFNGVFGAFDPIAELRRILAQRPKFIVTRDATFADAVPEGSQLQTLVGELDTYHALLGLLASTLRRDYELVRTYAPYEAWGGVLPGSAGWGAKVYRRRG